MRQVRLNTTVTTQFHPVDPVDEWNKVTGKSNDFTTTCWHDGEEATPDTLTITELEDTGEYVAALKFDEVGFWRVEIRLGDEYMQEWVEEFTVSRFLPEDAVRGRVL